MNLEKKEVLQSAYEYLPNLYKGIEETIRILKCEEASEQVYSNISQILEGLGWVMQALTLTKDIQIEKIEVHNLENILPDLLEAMENEDGILLSDLLEYEIMVCLEGWYDTLEIILNA